MKYKIVLLIIAVSLAISLCACSKENVDLVDMTFGTGDGYATIIWGDKTYVPYGVISRSDCGKQIGIVDGEEGYRVYEYKGYSTDEWIIEIFSAKKIPALMLWVREFKSCLFGKTACK